MNAVAPVEYWVETVAKSLGLIAAIFAIMEFYVCKESKARLLAEAAHGYFNSDLIKSLPARMVRKYRDRAFSLIKSSADARTFAFIIALDALMLVPITIFRYLPSQMPSRLFVFSPLVYYFLVAGSILFFLHSMSRALKDDAAPSPIATLVLFFFCFDIFNMSFFFVSMDKVELVRNAELSSVVFLGLNHVMSRAAALSIVTLVVGFSASLLLFAFLSFILSWLPEHVHSSIANYTARGMFLIGVYQAFLLGIAPGEKIDTGSHLIIYTSALIVIATTSGLLLLLLKGLEGRLFFSTIALVAMPFFAVFEYWQLLLINFPGVQFGDHSSALVLVGAPLIWIYLRALLSSLASTSVQTATLLFRSKEIALKPFGTASVFLGFLAVLVEFAFVQARFILGN